MTDSTERLETERLFHNRRFGETGRDKQDKFYFAIRDGAERFSQLVDEWTTGADVLEYGCGDASRASVFSVRAKSVVAIDISDVAIQLAQSAAPQRDNLKYSVMNAEALDFPDESFDLIYGSGIIHHLDLRKAYTEISRCLRPGGHAVFWEPLGHNPGINLYRRLTPGARTPDEHPLLLSDFELARRYFRNVNFQPYGLATLLTVPIRNRAGAKSALATARAMDKALFHVPGLARYAWFALITMTK